VSGGPLTHVVVAGSVTIDDTRVADRRYRKLGGVPTYAGLTYVREGIAAALVANVAAEDAGLLAVFAAEGLQAACGATEHTTRFANRVEHGGRRQQLRSTARPIAYDAMSQAAAAAAWVHLGPLHPDDLHAEVYARLSAADIPVVLDLQGLVRETRRGKVLPRASHLVPSALRAAGIVKTSHRERQIVQDALGAGVDRLMENFSIDEWVSTDGARGGCIHVRGREAVPYSAQPADALDPTGAGDVFLAAYAAARLGRNAPVAAAGRHAAAVAARQVAGRHIPFDLLQLPAGRR
jgi:sugar/nucleoside kinase (ribokinase family)